MAGVETVEILVATYNQYLNFELKCQDAKVLHAVYPSTRVGEWIFDLSKRNNFFVFHYS